MNKSMTENQRKYKKMKMDIQDVDKNEACSIYVNTKMNREVDVYIHGAIEKISDYTEMLNVLNGLNEGDNVKIHINSPGGCLATTIQIINGIKSCPANVFTVLNGEAASAATMIFLSADNYVVYKNSYMMIHNYSTCAYGKGHEINSYVDFTKDHFKNLFTNVYEGFLSTKEIEEVISGKDMWMSYEEILPRLTEKKKIIESRKDAEEAMKLVELRRELDDHISQIGIKLPSNKNFSDIKKNVEKKESKDSVKKKPVRKKKSGKK